MYCWCKKRDVIDNTNLWTFYLIIDIDEVWCMNSLLGTAVVCRWNSIISFSIMTISLTKAYDYHFIHVTVGMNKCYASGCYRSGKRGSLKFFRFSKSSAVSMCQWLVILILWHHHVCSQNILLWTDITLTQACQTEGHPRAIWVTFVLSWGPHSTCGLRAACLTCLT
jgi:hypothetical protein